MMQMALRINDFLNGLFSRESRLVDFKIEFGRLYKGRDAHRRRHDGDQPGHAGCGTSALRYKQMETGSAQDLGRASGPIQRRSAVVPASCPRGPERPRTPRAMQ